MEMSVIQMFIQAGLEIYQRHQDATGEKLTGEQVTEMLMSEIDSGQHMIAKWFLDKGLPLPK